MKEKVNEIMEIMNSIEYGFKDKNGENIINNKKKWDEEFNNFYYLQTPIELLETKCGVCWDQVELERYLFEKNKIEVSTYFIYMKEEDKLPSHTFLTFKENNKNYWFEHSWNKYKGIHEYETEKELLEDVKNKFINDHKEVKNNIIYCYKYEIPPKHITCDNFYKYIESNYKV